MKKYLNKLQYRSWHRGTKEADLFLGNFFDKYINHFNTKNLKMYESFLNIINDDEIISMVKGKKKWPNNVSIEIINLLEKYIKSEGFRK